MPRIVHVISIEGDRIGGAARVMLALLQGGRRRGWAQAVLNPYASDYRALADHCEGTPYETLTPHSARSFPRARRWLRSRLADLRPEILHVHLLHAELTVASLRRSPSTATVLTYHHHLHLQRAGRRLAARGDRIAARRFDRVVAVAEGGERFLRSEYALPPSRVTCIRNGWSGAPIAEPRKADRPTVICVANFREQKRHDVLLDAFVQARESVPDARLVLAGQGPLLDRTRERVGRLGLGDCVELAGSVDIWPRLAEAHVFALTSDYEGLSVAVLEAMAAGLPVVATEVEGNTDVVRPGETGLLFARGDSAACAGHLVALLGDGALRERMGAAGRATASEWTMDRCVDRYFELYEELLPPRSRHT